MLRPRKKLTRREIKEDTLVTAYVKTQKFYQSYSKQINIFITVLVVILAVIVIMAVSKRRAESTAIESLGMAEHLYFSQKYPTAIEELKKIVDLYSGTKAAGRATFLLANVYFNLGNFNSAEKYFWKYINEYSDFKIFTASSWAGIAACVESKGKFLDAAEYYRKAALKFPDVFNAPDYLENAGRCYEMAGDVEKAKEVYNYLIEKYPSSDIKGSVEFILKSL